MRMNRAAAVAALLLPLFGLAGGATPCRDAPGGAAPPPTLTEPSATLSVGARLLALTGEGESRRALVEINLFSRRELAELSLSRSRATGEAAPIEVPGAAGRLKAWNARKIQVDVDLADGEVNHLSFRAAGLDARGNLLESTATVRINLDPSRAPQRLDMEDHDLLQYRPGAGGM